MNKEYVYVVVSSNVDENPYEIEGVYKYKKDANKKLREIRKDWLEDARESEEFEIDEDEKDYFKLTTEEETMEVEIIIKEVR